MKVETSVFLVNGNKKVTKFTILPEIGEEALAVKILNDEVTNYVINNGILHQKFTDDDNPFVKLVVEGI
jgi:hypothetical protein